MSVITPERIAVKTKQQGGGRPPDPPKGPPPGGRGPGFGNFLVALLVLAVLWLIAHGQDGGVAEALVFFIGNLLRLVFAPILYLVSSYYAGVAAAMQAQLLSPMVLLFIWVATFVAISFLRSTKRLQVLAPTNYVQTKNKIRSTSLKSYVRGSLIILACFHTIIFFQLFGALPLVELTASLITIAQLVDQVRIAFFFPETADDLARAYEAFREARDAP